MAVKDLASVIVRGPLVVAIENFASIIFALGDTLRDRQYARSGYTDMMATHRGRQQLGLLPRWLPARQRVLV